MIKVNKNNLLTATLLFMFFIIAVAFAVLSEPYAKSDVISSVYGEQYFQIGEDIPAGVVSVDYKDGYGYLNVTRDGSLECYSNLGPERILRDHMEFDLAEGDYLQVSEGLKVNISYDEGVN